MSVTQHIFSIVANFLLSFFKVASSSEDSLLVRKNTIRGITKRVELRNVVHLVMKNISNSGNPVCKNMFQVSKIVLKKMSQCCSNAF